MQTKELEILDHTPFFAWVKDGDGRYMWANRALTEYAKVDLRGKTDRELPWADNADAFKKVDKEVLATGRSRYVHEHMHRPKEVELNVCKWPGELDGKRGVFGISFAIDE